MKELIIIITLLFTTLIYLSWEVEETITIIDYDWVEEGGVIKILEGEDYIIDSLYISRMDAIS